MFRAMVMVLNDYYLCYVNDRLAIYLQYNLNKYNKVLFRFISSSTIKTMLKGKTLSLRLGSERGGQAGRGWVYLPPVLIKNTRCL